MFSKKHIFILVLLFCFVENSFGYLDPGSGSYIIQMIIAGVLGSAYAIKIYWMKIVNFIKGTPKDSDEDLADE